MRHLGRKLFHLLGGLGLLSLYFMFGRSAAFSLYGALVVIVLMFEISRLKIPAWNSFITTRLGSLIRSNEEHKLTGTAPYILGVGLCLYAYSTPIAAAAVCFLAFGDVAATTVGERFGKTKIGEKSLEGTAAFVVAALAVGAVFFLLGAAVPPAVLIVGALFAAAIELLPIPVNDNFVIPILSGAIMELALRWMR